MRTEHLLALQVTGERALRAPFWRRRAQGRAHLVQVRHVASLQDQAHLGMREEIAGAADHVGVAGHPVRETGYDVLADVDQAHLGEEDAHHLTGQMLDGHGNGHVGLAFPHEVGGAEMGQSAPGLLEREGGREVGLVLGQDRAQTCGPGPHHPPRVEGNGLRDGGRDEQQLLELELIVRREPLGRHLPAARGRRHRAMDLLDELAELEGGSGAASCCREPMCSRIS